ncbi:DUF3817 domain-containing protein [Persephonella atlantica]|uniref:DUF3817 domain-containing protein n=1 Tax=Persephonella atlantica TaxID=2699429 RepID=A0ABS1GF49_9AQUI|nr:DUF3817 domain-containing protein [Persephonella atlantica]MBK3331563.1 DUF3817 domain-containing protein [Persephonella atlantica]
MDRLAKISFIEGVSLIVLVFVGMPLKYIFGYEIATKILGSIHGILWLVFLYVLYQVRKEFSLENSFTIKMLIFSVIPFGLIPMERLVNGKINKKDKGELVNA